ncbi:MAG: hypothetical protein ACREIA_24495, partial [Opitutaceae bacterium]
MVSLATLPASIRARANAASPELQRRFNARLRAMQVMARMPRNQWKHTAQRLAAGLAIEHGSGFSAKRIMDLWRDFRAQGPEALLFGYGANGSIPEEFKHWLSLRVEKNKRVASVELRAVATDWRAGER